MPRRTFRVTGSGSKWPQWIPGSQADPLSELILPPVLRLGQSHSIFERNFEGAGLCTITERKAESFSVV